MDQRIIIVGGGAVGLGLAYHLAKRGARRVCLLERHQLTSGTSWHAAGIVGPLRATPNMTRIAMYAADLFPRLEQESGVATGYRKTGGYWLARAPERMDELRRIAALGRHFGLAVDQVSGQQVNAALPIVDAAGLTGALSVAEDASVNPVDLCMAYAAAARSMGVEIRENTPVAALCHAHGYATGVRLANGETLSADRVALCAGAWSRQLAAPAGVALPLQAVEHMYVVTEPHASFHNFPVVRDLDRGIYIKGDTGKLVIGGFEPDAKVWHPEGSDGNQPFVEFPEDWQQFEPFIQAALALIPSLANVGIQYFMNGPESFTADTRPLVGATPALRNLYVAAGMNSVGVMSSAGIGRVLADWIVDGAPPMDLWEIDVARVDPRTASSAHLEARMREAVSDQFALHWPFKQPKHGRDLRQSALHDRWARVGAVFGLTAGWERGLWYARDSAERTLPYSVGAQPWQPIVAREIEILRDGCALIDLSPFAKFEVRGDGALEALGWLFTANMNVPVGRAVYGQFVNREGGIEADVTITRLEASRFRVVTAAGSRWRDFAWLRAHLPERVAIQDYTEEASVLGLMGGGVGALLQDIETALPRFGHTRQAEVFGIKCLATRLSFVGEFGFELEVDNTHAPELFDRLIESGAQPLGHYAVDSCRLEKGYRHWGHDIGPKLSPAEAGLGFTIDRGKTTIASAAWNAATGALRQRLFLCAVDGNPLILHDEPVWQGGRVVGLTTSGGYGCRTRLNLAFVLLDAGAAWSIEKPFEIDVAGERCDARVLKRAPYDPDNLRMRG